MKKGFTLIEILISIVLLLLLISVLYNVLNISKTSQTNIEHFIAQQKEYLFYNLVYLDILNATSKIDILQNDTNLQSILLFQTKNSIHSLYNPYVVYLVKNNKLYRVESNYKLRLPLNLEHRYFFADLIKNSIHRFKVYLSSQKNKVIFFINDKFFEVDTISSTQNRKIVVVQDSSSSSASKSSSKNLSNIQENAMPSLPGSK